MGIRGFKEGGIPSVPSLSAGTQRSVVLVLLFDLFFFPQFTAGFTVDIRLHSGHDITDPGLDILQSFFLAAAEIRNNDLAKIIHMRLGKNPSLLLEDLNFKIFFVNIDFDFFSGWHAGTFSRNGTCGAVS